MEKIAPLTSSFMLAAIVGFIISAYLITDISWKFTMLIFFSTMFIASYISMLKGPVVKRQIK